MTKSESKLLDNRLSLEEVDTSQFGNNTRFAFVAAVMMAIALVLPFAYRVDVGPGPDSIRAMIWDYIESSWYSGFRIWNPLDTLPYTLLRLIFAIMLARLYAGKTSPQRTLMVGVLAEIQPVLVSAPLVFLVDWPGDPWVPLYIPLPIMLMFGVALLLWFKYKQVE
ncbi:MAG: hypothetical protein ACXABV_12300 [Candidatus Thorarchaeota archaeon]|jgi:hypothetical protein